jgi:hypothetical protein
MRGHVKVFFKKIFFLGMDVMRTNVENNRNNHFPSIIKRNYLIRASPGKGNMKMSKSMLRPRAMRCM